jgi:hypothetical protein
VRRLIQSATSWERFMTQPFSSFNRAQSIADKYARATKQTIYVVHEANEFIVFTEEDLSTFLVGLSDNQIRYCTTEKVS